MATSSKGLDSFCSVTVMFFTLYRVGGLFFGELFLYSNLMILVLAVLHDRLSWLRSRSFSCCSFDSLLRF